MKKVVRVLLSVPIFFKIIGVVALVAVLFGAVTIHRVDRCLTEFLYADLKERAISTGLSLADDVTRSVVIRDVISLHDILTKQKAGLPDAEYFCVLDAHGNILAQWTAGSGPDNAVFLTRIQSARASTRDVGRDSIRVFRDGDRYIVESRALILEGNAGWVMVGLSDARIARVIRAITSSFLLALILCVAAGQFMAFLLAGAIVKPIHRLTEVSESIREGNLSARVDVDRSDEMGRLADTFNQMAQSLMDHQEDIRRRQSERETLLKMLVSAQEKEKKSIARELHDDLGPSLSSALWMMETLKCECPRPEKGCFTEVEKLVRKAIEDMRQMAFTLRPSILDDYGLETALGRYIGFIRKHAGIRIDYRYADMMKFKRLPESIETAFYRIAQEALSNARRHSGAGNVSVVVIHKEGEAALIIEDDGAGFDPAAPRTDDGGGMGLAGMRERVALLNGTFFVESQPGRGTGIHVTVPVTYEEAGA